VELSTVRTAIGTFYGGYVELSTVRTAIGTFYGGYVTTSSTVRLEQILSQVGTSLC
jgi:hypothetical protein